MAVIVDDELAADLLGVEARAGRAERPQADRNVDHPVQRHKERRQIADSGWSGAERHGIRGHAMRSRGPL